MSIVSKITSILTAKKREEPTSWQLVLICADGLPEVQGYDIQQEAIDAGKNQLGTGDGDCKVARYYVQPINTHSIARRMVASA